MELISKKSILIIAPSLIAESLSLKLTSLDQNLDINFNNGTGDKTPDLVIWNILNFQAEDGIRDRSPSRGLGDVYKRQIPYN